MLSTLKELFGEDAVKLQIFSVILIVASNIFAGFALYYDSHLCNIKHYRIYTALGFVFGLPALALYFIFRKLMKQEVPIICTNCGKRVKKGVKECPKCKNKHFAPQIIENRSAIKQKTMTFIAIALVLLIAQYYVENYSPLAKSVEQQTESQYEEADDDDENSVFSADSDDEDSGESVFING